MVQQQAHNVIQGQPFERGAEVDSSLWADFKAKVDSLKDSGLVAENRATELLDHIRTALTDSLLPAYQDLIERTEAVLSIAPREAQGVSSLPDGGAYYKYLLEFFTTTELSAQEIHDIGREEVARIRVLMNAVRESVDFEGTLGPLFGTAGKGNGLLRGLIQ
jgi:uncharacterized protein (DUF885 family)